MCIIIGESTFDVLVFPINSSVQLLLDTAQKSYQTPCQRSDLQDDANEDHMDEYVIRNNLDFSDVYAGDYADEVPLRGMCSHQHLKFYY